MEKAVHSNLAKHFGPEQSFYQNAKQTSFAYEV